MNRAGHEAKQLLNDYMCFSVTLILILIFCLLIKITDEQASSFLTEHQHD